MAIWKAEGSFNKQRYDLSTNKNVPCTWKEYDWKEIYRSRASAALTAMREPTQEMVKTGYLISGLEEGGDVSLSETYQAMIDEALK